MPKILPLARLKIRKAHHIKIALIPSRNRVGRYQRPLINNLLCQLLDDREGVFRRPFTVCRL